MAKKKNLTKAERKKARFSTAENGAGSERTGTDGRTI